MAEAESKSITFKEFLETVPPGTFAQISDLASNIFYVGDGSKNSRLQTPEILLHCTDKICSGPRVFKSSTSANFAANVGQNLFVDYVCKNCSEEIKTFALWLSVDDALKKGNAYKYGEVPKYGPPTPARLTSLIGPQKELFLKGRRSENQGLGIAAFAYYRRVIEGQKNRIFDEIIKVCERLPVDKTFIDELTKAKAETQFIKAVASIKQGIPQALLINGHNPLTLLHSALSEGLHADTDEECLELATSVREVMAELAERMAQVMKDEANLNSAVNRLLQKKAVGLPAPK